MGRLPYACRHFSSQDREEVGARYSEDPLSARNRRGHRLAATIRVPIFFHPVTRPSHVSPSPFVPAVFFRGYNSQPFHTLSAEDRQVAIEVVGRTLKYW